MHTILGMAGHIDHGKSALVQALTGVDPDRLPEEQARGMTIDLGFAHLEIDSPKQPDTRYQIGIVDVPGHAGFINNMVSGIGSIDVAVLTVAADDGWMPQSEEHLQILDYLGIKRMVVALTKADLLGDDRPIVDCPVIADIRKRLADSPFADAPIVPTSVVSGRGLDQLQATLADILDQTPAPIDIGKPRLPVDRVFTHQGFGTIVTGTLTGGTLHRGQSVVVQPTGFSTRIRSIQSQNKDLESVGPGMRAALNLTDLPVAGKGRTGIARGEVITLAELGKPTETIHAWITQTDRGLANPLPLKHASPVRWHHGGSHVPAKVYLIDREQLGEGESALAQIRLERPLLVFAGDRFLVRSWSKSSTLAGGVVLETDAKRRHYRNAQQIASLQACLEARGDVQKSILAFLSRCQAIDCQKLLLQSSFSSSQIEAAIGELAEQRELIIAGNYVVDAAWWNDLIHQAVSRIDAEHAQNPQHLGLDLSELRSQFETKLPAAPLFDELIRCLCRQNIVKQGIAIRRESHMPELPSHLSSAGAKIRKLLGGEPFKPPARKEIDKDKKSAEALRFLIQQGEVIEVSADLVFQQESYQQAKDKVRHYLLENGSATLSQLRELLGTNRRVIVPLVEHFDRDGLTLRRGDTRVLK